MSWRRTAAAVSWLTVSSACGGGSTTDLPLRVTSPAAPTTSDWSVSGRVTTQAGVPIAGAVVSPPGLPTLLTSAAGAYTVAGLGSPAQDPYPLEITANNYLRRRVWVRWQPGARIGVDVDLISLSSPFSLTFYRELARDAQETPGALKPLELWPGGNPNVYVRTVDQNGDAIAQDVLDGVYDTIPGAVSDWTNGKLSVGDARARSGGAVASGRLDHRHLRAPAIRGRHLRPVVHRRAGGHDPVRRRRRAAAAATRCRVRSSPMKSATRWGSSTCPTRAR